MPFAHSLPADDLCACLPLRLLLPFNLFVYIYVSYVFSLALSGVLTCVSSHPHSCTLTLQIGALQYPNSSTASFSVCLSVCLSVPLSLSYSLSLWFSLRCLFSLVVFADFVLLILPWICCIAENTIVLCSDCTFLMYYMVFQVKRICVNIRNTWHSTQCSAPCGPCG